MALGDINIAIQRNLAELVFPLLHIVNTITNHVTNRDTIVRRIYVLSIESQRIVEFQIGRTVFLDPVQNITHFGVGDSLNNSHLVRQVPCDAVRINSVCHVLVVTIFRHIPQTCLLFIPHAIFAYVAGHVCFVLIVFVCSHLAQCPDQNTLGLCHVETSYAVIIEETVSGLKLGCIGCVAKVPCRAISHTLFDLRSTKLSQHRIAVFVQLLRCFVCVQPYTIGCTCNLMNLGRIHVAIGLILGIVLCTRLYNQCLPCKDCLLRLFGLRYNVILTDVRCAVFYHSDVLVVTRFLNGNLISSRFTFFVVFGLDIIEI